MMLKVVGGLMRVAGLVWGRRCGLRALKAPLLLHLAHICGILGQKWSFRWEPSQPGNYPQA